MGDKKVHSQVEFPTMSVSAALQRCSREMLEENDINFTFKTKKGDFYHVSIKIEQVKEYTDENGVTWERKK